MTKPKLDNTLYLHLASSVTQALPLEYAIRAVRTNNPLELAKLGALDVRIRQYWRDLGASDAEIDGERLMDHAWDILQVGFEMSLRASRVYENLTLLNLINIGRANIEDQFAKELEGLRIPVMKYFRICDLLRGNDIQRLMGSTAQCLRDAKAIESRFDEVELKKFVHNIRVPFHLHPGMQYVIGEHPRRNAKAERFGILLDSDADISMPDLVRQIRLFLYQYSLRREALSPAFSRDSVSDELINTFLSDTLLGKIPQQKAARLDGLIGPLAGLYCWDLARQYEKEEKEAPVLQAQLDTLKCYPAFVRKVDEEAMRKNYRLTAEAIRNVPFANALNL